MVYILIVVSFALVHNHRFSQFLFSLQVIIVTLAAIFTPLGLRVALSLSMNVGMQLAVRNRF
jgi:hypothetical protein